MAAKKRSKKKAKKKSVRRPIQSYAFVDTNIFLDFYRNSNEASLSLLKKLESVKERIICTYQVEAEFLKNRQGAIRKIADEASLNLNAKLPAVLSDTSLDAWIGKTNKDAKKRKTQLNKRLAKLLSQTGSDPVYKVFEDIFRSESDHVLTRDMDVKEDIKELARRRFELGYPPRKRNDTSMGDAVNWEWIIHCASRLTGRIIIVTRDSDFGCTFNGKSFLNDQLKQEFRERVGRKSIVLTEKLSEALNQLNVRVTQKEIESEQKVVLSRSARIALENSSELRKKLAAVIGDRELQERLARIRIKQLNDQEELRKILLSAPIFPSDSDD
jgi:hypothetical protein